MSKNKDKRSKKEINKEINKRATAHQMVIYVDRCIDLLRQNLNYRDIKKILVKETGKSHRTVEKYIFKAAKIIRQDYEDSKVHRQSEFFESLYGDLKEAQKMYESIHDPQDKMKAVWFKLVLDVKDKMSRYIDTSPKEEDNQTIKVQYQILPPKEDDE